MTNKKFGQKVELRTKMFSIAVIRLSSSLDNSQEARVIRNQVTKSATSVGANYREANGPRSPNDFKNKIKFAKTKQARQLIGWK